MKLIYSGYYYCFYSKLCMELIYCESYPMQSAISEFMHVILGIENRKQVDEIQSFKSAIDLCMPLHAVYPYNTLDHIAVIITDTAI